MSYPNYPESNATEGRGNEPQPARAGTTAVGSKTQDPLATLSEHYEQLLVEMQPERSKTAVDRPFSV